MKRLSILTLFITCIGSTMLAMQQDAEQTKSFCCPWYCCNTYIQENTTKNIQERQTGKQSMTVQDVKAPQNIKVPWIAWINNSNSPTSGDIINDFCEIEHEQLKENVEYQACIKAQEYFNQLLNPNNPKHPRPTNPVVIFDIDDTLINIKTCQARPFVKQLYDCLHTKGFTLVLVTARPEIPSDTHVLSNAGYTKHKKCIFMPSEKYLEATELPNATQLQAMNTWKQSIRQQIVDGTYSDSLQGPCTIVGTVDTSDVHNRGTNAGFPVRIPDELLNK